MCGCRYSSSDSEEDAVKNEKYLQILIEFRNILDVLREHCLHKVDCISPDFLVS
jgi:hypothetical protein